jgi:hypothetical protein
MSAVHRMDHLRFEDPSSSGYGAVRRIERCNACGRSAAGLRTLDNFDDDPWLVCASCVDEDADGDDAV